MSHHSLIHLDQILAHMDNCKNHNDIDKKVNDFQKICKLILEEQKSHISEITKLYNDTQYYIQLKNSSITGHDIHTSPVIGIDLGTSNSSVGYYRLNASNIGEIEIISDDGITSFPSVVCYK